MGSDSLGALSSLLIFLATAIVAVPLFKRMGLASVLGYLLAGSLLGPFGLRVVNEPRRLLDFAEIGIVLLLFLIGLELKPSRVWSMRRQVFGAGLGQVVITGGLLAAAGLLGAGLDGGQSLLIGAALSLSSTAFALQMLSERGQMNTRSGRLAFSILLFQDVAAIPLLAIVPFLAPVQAPTPGGYNFMGLIMAAGAVAATPFLMRPTFRVIASTRIRELFTAATLLLVLGLGWIMQRVGLSMALGSFVGGILLSDSEYRHQLEADIEPFKGLLLGLFFMVIGMEVNYGLLVQHPLRMLAWTVGMMAIKAFVTYLIGRRSKLSPGDAWQMSVILPQGGEFALVIFAVAANHDLLSPDVSDVLDLMIALSMALTPVLAMVSDQLVRRMKNTVAPEYDQFESERNRFIIAGFGRFGQVVGRVLRTMEIEFTALELDPDQVEVLRRFGNKVHYGDASRLDLLEAAGAETAEFLIVCIDDVESSMRVVEVAQKHFGHLKVFARARNRQHAYRLMDHGVHHIFRETLGSSLEMAENLLESLGYPSQQALATIRTFRHHDEQMLLAQHKVYKDEKQLIRTSREAAEQLAQVMRADKETPSASSLH